MKDKKAVLYGKPFSCPCCGSELGINATVRIKCVRELGQDRMDDYPTKDEEQEAGDGA